MRRLAQTVFLQFPIGAYLILALGFGWAMWDDEQDDRRTDRALCAAAQKTRQEFRNYIVDSTETLEVPADATEDVRRIYEDANRLNAEFRDKQLAELPSLVCKNGKPEPVNINDNGKDDGSTTVTATTTLRAPEPVPPAVRVIPVPGPVGPVGPVGPQGPPGSAVAGPPGPPGTVIVVVPPTTVQATTTTRLPVTSTTGTTSTTSTTTTVATTTTTTRPPGLICSLLQALRIPCRD